MPGCSADGRGCRRSEAQLTAREVLPLKPIALLPIVGGLLMNEADDANPQGEASPPKARKIRKAKMQAVRFSRKIIAGVRAPAMFFRSCRSLFVGRYFLRAMNRPSRS